MYRKQEPSRAICGFGLGVAMAWFLVDLQQVLGDPGVTSPTQRLWGVGVLVLMAALAGSAGQLVASASVFSVRLFRRLPGRRETLFSILPLAILLFLFLAPRIVELLSGPWIIEQAWRPALLVTLLFVTFAFVVWAGSHLCRVINDHGRIPWHYGLGMLAICIGSFLGDGHGALVRKHAALHDILALVGLLAAGFFGASILGSRWRRLGLIEVATGALTIILISTGILPGESGYLRRLVLKSTRLTARAFDHQDAPPDPTLMDLDLLVDLRRGQTIKADVLDRLLPGRKTRDIVLITIDTLRHDLIQDGKMENLTPNLDRQFAESVVFTNAWSQFPSSRHAIHSMFTGHYPTASVIFPGSRASEGAADDGPQSLAASLAQTGYLTSAFTAFEPDFYARESHHLTRGFQTTDNDSGDPVSASERVVAKAIRALGEDETDGPPRFVWVHLFDPHEPYRPHGETKSTLGKRQRYDSEVRYADRCLGRLFSFLNSSDKNRVVIVQSDHGEEFRDHGGMGHHSSLFEEQIKIPLAIRGPGFVPNRVKRPVELIDLPATLCQLVGARSIAKDKGHSLLPILLGFDVSTWPSEYVFSQFREPRFVHGALDAIRSQDWKLIADRRLGLYELFDLRNDPYERTNLADINEKKLNQMKRALATMTAYAGSEVQNRDALERALLQRAIGGTLARNELPALKAAFRREKIVLPEMLPKLLDSPDVEIRRAALVHVATFADGLGRAHLSRTALESQGEAAVEADVGLALLGDEDSPERLENLDEDFFGTDRFLLATARFVAGEQILGPAIHQLLADPNNDRDLDTLAIYSLMRIRDPWLLTSLYARTNLGFRYAEHRTAAFDVASRMVFHLSSPLMRRFLNNPDRAVRQSAEAFVALDPGLAPWRRQALKAEALAEKARALGIGPASLDLATPLYLSCLDMMAEVGVFDWGYVLELSFLWTVNGRRSGLSDLLIPKMPAAESLSNSFALALTRRMLRVAQTANLKVRAHLKLVPGQELKPADQGRINLLVELRLESESAALIGGIGTKTSYLGAALLDRRGRLIGEALSLPLPLTGVLPGERIVLAVPVSVGEGRDRAAKLGIRLGRADNELAPPIVIDLDR